MAVLALKTSSFRNAVSVLHRDGSQDMFQDLWPKLPVEEVPITSVTNGVHCADLDQWRSRRPLRPVPAAGLARTAGRRADVGTGA